MYGKYKKKMKQRKLQLKKLQVLKKTSSTKKVNSSKTGTKKPTPKKETVKKDNIKNEEVKVTEKKETKVVSNTKRNAVIRNIILVALLAVFFIVVAVISGNNSKEYSNGTSSSSSTSSQTTTGDAQSESASIKDDEKKELNNINIDKYLELLKADSYSIIYIGRPTCSHCAVQKPIMEHLVYKYDLVINYLNTDELSEEGFNKLQKSNEYFSSGWGTPTTLVVKNNEIVDKFEGETSIEDLTTMFKKYNFISE